MKKYIEYLKTVEKWQVKRLIFCFLTIFIIGVAYLGTTLFTLYKDKTNEKVYWESSMNEKSNLSDKEYQELTKDAVKITTGTYVENLKHIDLKTNTYRLDFVAWFRWNGDPSIDIMNHFRVYKGVINKFEKIKDYHENGDNYQLVRIDATISKNYWTKRFPLESHQFRFYLESEITADKVLLVPDKENSSINRSISISGYDLRQHDVGSFLNQYPSTQNDPTLEKAVTTSEMMTQLEINRSGFGVYLKCFIALFGTTAWVLITLFINTYHRVDPLGMIPAALFGTVSNIMVGANLLPDALDLGLLEYVNVFGIMTILAVTFWIININRIRSKASNKEFATLFGKIMFFTILIFVIVAHIAYPLTAYLWH
ncbi:MAG: hypothetical protein RR624_04185 [Longicatena sp.]